MGARCLRQRLDTHRKGASSTTTVMPLDSHSGVSGAMPKRHSSRFLLRVQWTPMLKPMFVRPAGSSTDASDEQPWKARSPMLVRPQRDRRERKPVCIKTKIHRNKAPRNMDRLSCASQDLASMGGKTSKKAEPRGSSITVSLYCTQGLATNISSALRWRAPPVCLYVLNLPY